MSRRQNSAPPSIDAEPRTRAAKAAQLGTVTEKPPVADSLSTRTTRPSSISSVRPSYPFVDALTKNRKTADAAKTATATQSNNAAPKEKEPKEAGTPVSNPYGTSPVQADSNAADSQSQGTAPVTNDEATRDKATPDTQAKTTDVVAPQVPATMAVIDGHGDQIEASTTVAIQLQMTDTLSTPAAAVSSSECAALKTSDHLRGTIDGEEEEVMSPQIQSLDGKLHPSPFVQTPPTPANPTRNAFTGLPLPAKDDPFQTVPDQVPGYLNAPEEGFPTRNLPYTLHYHNVDPRQIEDLGKMVDPFTVVAYAMGRKHTPSEMRQLEAEVTRAVNAIITPRDGITIVALIAENDPATMGNMPALSAVILGLTDKERDALLSQEVLAPLTPAMWPIAFFNPYDTIHNVAVVLEGLSLDGSKESCDVVRRMVIDSLKKCEELYDYFRVHNDRFPANTHPDTVFAETLDSVKVTALFMKANRNAADRYEFVVHINTPFRGVMPLADYLRILYYQEYMAELSRGGRGKPRRPYLCGLCFGIDHPRGHCPFPDIKGWPSAPNPDAPVDSAPVSAFGFGSNVGIRQGAPPGHDLSVARNNRGTRQRGNASRGYRGGRGNRGTRNTYYDSPYM